MGSRNSNSVNQKKRRGRKRKKALIIFAVIAAVAGMLFGVTYKVFEADTIEFAIFQDFWTKRHQNTIYPEI